MEKELTKTEFKKMYMNYRTDGIPAFLIFFIITYSYFSSERFN
jgi:hypothetical protein